MRHEKYRTTLDIPSGFETNKEAIETTIKISHAKAKEDAPGFEFFSVRLYSPLDYPSLSGNHKLVCEYRYYF